MRRLIVAGAVAALGPLAVAIAAGGAAAGSIAVEVGFHAGSDVGSSTASVSSPGIFLVGPPGRLVPVKDPFATPESPDYGPPGTFKYTYDRYTYLARIVYATRFFPPEHVPGASELVTQLNARIQLVSSDDPACKAPAVGTLLLRRYGASSSWGPGEIDMNFPGCTARAHPLFPAEAEVFLRQTSPPPGGKSTPPATTTVANPAAEPTSVTLTVNSATSTLNLTTGKESDTGTYAYGNYNVIPTETSPGAGVTMDVRTNKPLPPGWSLTLQWTGGTGYLCQTQVSQTCSADDTYAAEAPNYSITGDIHSPTFVRGVTILIAANPTCTDGKTASQDGGTCPGSR